MTARDTPTPGLRERKKAATRAALREVAVRLGREHGPDAVTVEAICAEVDVSPRTFFNHFTSKDDAFFGAGPEGTTDLTDAVVARPADEDPLTATAGVLADILDTATGSGVWHQQLLLLREHPELLGRMHAATKATEAALAEGIARRTDRTVADPYVLTTAATAMTALRVAVGLWLDHPESPETAARDHLDGVVALVRAGLAPPP
ncbi:TetR family transcriptional regulator [Actinomycetospora succinea]|uniref:TetR family transcriptional regulator n=1 Tax=Actinomycetospora succinea TaxID=663603 RepID=A0A4R6VD82_9PSEU|nr:TetR/AcrR family transcriptional regulator [Actinomycetospora succinea]TDQ58320.1 TetR family transcriptional regulator [Actinomycetospora succinea]